MENATVNKIEKGVGIATMLMPLLGYGILGYVGYRAISKIFSFGSQTAQNIRDIMKEGPAPETVKPITTAAYGFSNTDYMNWMDKPVYSTGNTNAMRKLAKSNAAVVSYPPAGSLVGYFYSVELEMLVNADGTKRGKVWVEVSNGAGGPTIGFIPLANVSLFPVLSGLGLIQVA